MTIPNTKACSVAGKLMAGAICAETITGKKSEMTLDEFISFLEPQEAAGSEPARAGAICRSAADDGKLKTALEQACRELGRRCSYEMRAAIKGMQ